MSGQNTLLVPLGQIQEQFWDKLTDAPLAGGILYFWSDPACTIPKLVYSLTGVPPDFTYTPFGASVTLSSIGTTDDGAGNNFTPYLYPYSDTILDGSGTIQLYYITVYNADGQYQFTAQGVPNAPIGSGPTPIGSSNTNFILNGQFVLHNNITGGGAIIAETTNVAYGGWQFVKSTVGADDFVTFERFPSPITSPSGNPRYSCRVKCTSPLSDTQKVLQIRFNDVNRFSTASGQDLTLFFSGKNRLAGDIGITVNLYKNFGSGGSAETNDSIAIAGPFTPTYQNFLCPFNFGSNLGKTLGAGDEDYFAIQIVLPPAAIFDIEVTDFVLYLGNVTVDSYPLTTDPIIPSPLTYTNSLLTADTNGGMSWQSTLPSDITIGDGLVTDPTTSTAATIDTALLDVLNYNPTCYNAYITSPQPLSATTNFQAVPGTSITIPAGTYLVGYSCTEYITVNTVGAGYQMDSTIYQTSSPSGPLFPISQLMILDGAMVGSLGGTAAYAQIVTFTSPVTLQIYADLKTLTYVTSIFVSSASIYAIALGRANP